MYSYQFLLDTFLFAKLGILSDFPHVFFSIRFFILEHLQIIGPYGKEENMFNIFIYLTIHIYLTILY